MFIKVQLTPVLLTAKVIPAATAILKQCPLHILESLTLTIDLPNTTRPLKLNRAIAITCELQLLTEKCIRVPWVIPLNAELTVSIYLVELSLPVGEIVT